MTMEYMEKDSGTKWTKKNEVAKTKLDDVENSSIGDETSQNN